VPTRQGAWRWCPQPCPCQRPPRGRAHLAARRRGIGVACRCRRRRGLRSRAVPDRPEQAGGVRVCAQSLSDVDRAGRAIVASSSVAAVLVGLLYGGVAMLNRLVLADFYIRRAPTKAVLRDTLAVRGQVGRTPFGPLSTSTVVLGSVALLAAIPCVALAVENARGREDELYRPQYMLWTVSLARCLVIVADCALGLWSFSRLSRRWSARVLPRLPQQIVGDRGPAERVTTRAQRRVLRRAWGPLDWAAWAGGVLVAVGAGICSSACTCDSPVSVPNASATRMLSRTSSTCRPSSAVRSSRRASH
jgi:hypothetical protein